MPTTQELRQHTRYSTEMIISIYHERWLHPIEVRSKDISLGGIFIYTKYTSDLPEKIILSITIPTIDERYVTFDGEVVHTVPGVGVGVRFITKSRHLNSLIAKLQKLANQSKISF